MPKLIKKTWRWIQIGTSCASRFCETFLLNPITQALLAILVVFVGFWASLFGPEIRSAFPFYPGPYDYISPQAVTFWSTFIVAALVYVFSFCLNRKIEREGRMQLRDAIMHAPPKNWMEQFSIRFSDNQRMVDKIRPGTDKEVVEEAIRVLLYSVADLINILSPRAGRRVAANLMVYIPIKSLQQEGLDQMQKILQFCDQDTGIAMLEGILHLDPKLSIVLEGENAVYSVDDELPEFALAIPGTTVSLDGRHRVGPGAPFAFVNKELSYFPHADKVLEWATTEGDFRDEVIAELKDYFGKGSHIQSFISIPIRDGYAKNLTSIAVLNIHCNKKNLLSIDDETIDFIYRTLLTFEPLVVKLLKEWEK